MKKYVFIILAVISTVAFTQVNAQKHRHTPQAAATQTTAQTAKATTTTESGELVDSVNKGYTAYSDTTSAAGDNAVVTDQKDMNADDSAIITGNINGDLNDDTIKAIAIAGIVLCIIFVIAPVAIIGMILLYLYKRNKRKEKVIQEAAANGQPIPQEMIQEKKAGDEQLLQKGIKHVAVGLGLVVMFYVMGIDFLSAIGWFVTIYGAGQIVIAYMSGAKGQIKFRNPIYSDNVTVKEEEDNYDKSE